MSEPGRALSTPWLATTAVVLSAACWGFSTVATKSLLDTIPPFQLLALQLAASVAFLWLAALLGRASFAGVRRVKGIALSGLLEPGLAYGVSVPGLALTSAANASVIGAAEPAFICAIAWLVLAARPERRVVAGMAGATAGVLLVTLGGAERLGGGSLPGDALVMLGAAFAALYVVVSSRLVGEMAPLPLAALQQSVGLACALALLVLARITGFEAPAGLPPRLLLAGAATGIVQYALAVWLYLMALRVLPPAVAGTYLALIPAFGVTGALVVLGETVSPAQALGALLVIGAVGTIARRRTGQETAGAHSTPG